MAKLIKPCNVKGCCLTGIHVPLTTTEIIPNGASSLVVAANATTTVVNELCQTVYQLPGSVLRLASDVWAHVKKEPKKPTWNIQTTIVMGFLQAFRDQSLTNSLEFWRLMLIAPTFITPLTSKTEQLTIPIKRRGLCGILRKADQEESGNRTLDSEWMSAVSTWEKIYGGPSRPRPTSSGLLLEAPPSCEKIVLYFHGGAYCAMSAQTHRTLTHKISKATNRRVLGK